MVTMIKKVHPVGTLDESDISKGFSSFLLMFTMLVYEKYIWKHKK